MALPVVGISSPLLIDCLKKIAVANNFKMLDAGYRQNTHRRDWGGELLALFGVSPRKIGEDIGDY